MRRLQRTFAGRIVAAAIVGSIAVVSAHADSTGIEIRTQHLTGNELRLVVETYRTWMPPLSHSSKTADAKGYLITIDLASKRPLADRAAVVGPLWDVPNPRSSISFEAGANFNQEDVTAAKTTPMCTFDRGGTLLRFTRDANRKVMVRDELVVAPGNGFWKRQGDVLSIHDRLPPMSEDRLLTGSGRYILLFQDGKAECFNHFTGAKKDDAWLTQRFAEARSIKDLNNVRLFLTDDLNHLVVSPMAIWNNGEGKTFETFDIGGNTYQRGDVGLAYSRSSEKPVVFKRRINGRAGFLDEPPHGAFSIGGELYLFANDKAALRLYSPDGKKEIISKASPGVKWEAVPFPQIQHAQAENELVIFGSNEITQTAGPNEILNVARWNYATNQVRRDEVKILDLFEQRSGQLHPKAVTTVDAAVPVKRSAE